MSILDYYKYATLATAAYVRAGAINPLDADYQQRFSELARQQDRLPQSIAQYLFDPENAFGNLDVWTVAQYFGGDIPGYSDKTGFAATLFRKNEENVLAVRGVEPTFSLDGPRDLLGASIGGIGLLGVAVNQLVDLVNLVLRMGAGPVLQLRAEITDSALEATGVVYVPLKGISIPSTSNPNVPDIETTVFLALRTYEEQGSGVLDSGAKVTLTGHSLGGHLAVAAAQILGDRVNPDVYVFNSAGFDPSSVNVATAISSLSSFLGSAVLGLIGGGKTLLAESLGAGALAISGEAQRQSEKILIGLRTALGTTANAIIIHNLESEDSAPGDDQSVVASIFTGQGKLGPEKLVGTEHNSHVIEHMMDALALQAAIYRLDKSLDLTTLKKFLDAAHHKAELSEETLVEALHALLIPGSRFAADRLQLPISNASGLSPWVGKGGINARNDMHTALLEINKRLDGIDLSATRVVSMWEENNQPLTVEQIVQRTKTAGPDGYAYRYALKHLLPFAVTGVDYGIHNTQDQLERYDPAQKKGGLSDAWLTDRAQFLLWKTVADVTDAGQFDRRNIVRDTAVTEQRRYVDLAQNYLVNVVNPDAPLDLDAASRVVFGGDSSELLVGTAKADRLYGGGGTDYLQGKGEADYLEGGAGIDVYEYNGYAAFFSGNRLFSGNDGSDLILDTDGKGVLRYIWNDNPAPVSTVIADASVKISATEWQSADGKFRYVRSANAEGGSDLTVTITADADGTMVIKDFRDGDFGISLGTA